MLSLRVIFRGDGTACLILSAIRLKPGSGRYKIVARIVAGLWGAKCGIDHLRVSLLLMTKVLYRNRTSASSKETSLPKVSGKI